MTAHNTADMLRRLEQVVNTDLNVDAAVLGRRLLARMRGPAHIALVGRAGVGKSLLAEVLTIQADLSMCRFSETTLDDDPAILAQATTQSDIVLWCGQEFNGADCAAWATIPDVLKDHSFFVLTKADVLAANGQLESALQSLRQVAADDFQGMFPMATAQALASCGQDQSAALRASGAAALKAKLLHQLSLDRGATRDSAFLYLSRFEKSGVGLVTASPSATSHSVSIWADPLTYLQAQADELRNRLPVQQAEKIRAVLEHCRETAEELANRMGQPAGMPKENAARAREILAVADTMVLLQLEGSASAAADALTILLQLRRDFAQLVNHYNNA